MRRLSPETVPFLFLVNLGLQIWDGIATYHGLRLGFPEGNPLVRTLIAEWGLAFGLVGAKSTACGLLVSLRLLRAHPLIPHALMLTALWYATFSFLPWMSLFLL